MKLHSKIKTKSRVEENGNVESQSLLQSVSSCFVKGQTCRVHCKPTPNLKWCKRWSGSDNKDYSKFNEVLVHKVLNHDARQVGLVELFSLKKEFKNQFYNVRHIIYNNETFGWRVKILDLLKIQVKGKQIRKEEKRRPRTIEITVDNQLLTCLPSLLLTKVFWPVLSWRK